MLRIDRFDAFDAAPPWFRLDVVAFAPGATACDVLRSVQDADAHGQIYADTALCTRA